MFAAIRLALNGQTMQVIAMLRANGSLPSAVSGLRAQLKILTLRGIRELASNTARIPVRKTPSKVPAPPMETTGAPRPCTRPRFS
jgi:hypothetical protein